MTSGIWILEEGGGGGGGLCIDLTVLELSHSVDRVGLDSEICLPLPPRDMNSDIVLVLSFELASLPNAVGGRDRC